MPHETAIAGQGGAWTPLSLGNLAAWYDASAVGCAFEDEAGTDQCEDADGIATLLDQSGFNRHLTQPTASKRLVFRTNQQNGKPALVGIGGDDSLYNAADLIGTGNVTVFVAFKAAGWGGGSLGRIIDNAKALTTVSSNGTFRQYSNGNNSTYSELGSIALNTAYVVCVTRTAFGVTNFFINGELSGNANQLNGTPAAGAQTVFGNNAAGDRGFNGNLYEIGICYSILTAPQIASLTAQLRAKWGI